MKAASGETDSGGDMKLWPMVDGLSLEMLWVRDREVILVSGGETMPDDGRDMAALKGGVKRRRAIQRI